MCVCAPTSIIIGESISLLQSARTADWIGVAATIHRSVSACFRLCQAFASTLLANFDEPETHLVKALQIYYKFNKANYTLAISIMMPKNIVPHFVVVRAKLSQANMLIEAKIPRPQSRPPLHRRMPMPIEACLLGGKS